MTFGGLRAMWLFVMFDLPVATKLDRRRYALFRKALLADGFSAIQFSVYVRPCPSEENLQVHRARVQRSLPPRGEVRLFAFTDKQFARSDVFHGKTRGMPEEMPSQLTLF